jgi:hypothetical protein
LPQCNKTFTKETHRDREKNISVPNFFSVGYLQMVCKAISFLARYIWKKTSRMSEFWQYRQLNIGKAKAMEDAITQFEQLHAMRLLKKATWTRKKRALVLWNVWCVYA